MKKKAPKRESENEEKLPEKKRKTEEPKGLKSTREILKKVSSQERAVSLGQKRAEIVRQLSALNEKLQIIPSQKKVSLSF